MIVACWGPETRTVVWVTIPVVRALCAAVVRRPVLETFCGMSGSLSGSGPAPRPFRSANFFRRHLARRREGGALDRRPGPDPESFQPQAL